MAATRVYSTAAYWIAAAVAIALSCAPRWARRSRRFRRACWAARRSCCTGWSALRPRPGLTVPTDASHLDLDLRPAAGRALAGAGRHQPLQRGDGPAALCAGGDAAAQRHGPAPRRGKAAGFTLEWEEKPYEWIPGRHFRQSRVFTKGPFRRFGPVFDLEPDGKGGRKVSYALEWEPLTLIGRLFGARLAARRARRSASASWRPSPCAGLGASARRRSSCRRPNCPTARASGPGRWPREIDRSPYGNGLGARLADIVLGGMAADLAPLEAQDAGARSRRAAARRHRGLPRRRAGGASRP